jgi:hypothetical protein
LGKRPEMTIIITDEDVKRLLPMQDCIEAMRVAFRDLSTGSAVNRPRMRYVAEHPDNEVDGHGSISWASMKSERPSWASGHGINILFQVGPKREPDLPNVPLWADLAQNDEQRQVLATLSSFVAVGRPFLTAPNVPVDRVKALRQAFDETMRDPSFLEAAEKAHMYLNPPAGDELQHVVEHIIGQPPAVIAKLKQAIEIKDVHGVGEGRAK